MLDAALRGSLLLAGLLVTGAATCALLLPHHSRARITTLAVVASVWSVVALPLRLFRQASAFVDVGEPVGPMLRVVLRETTWGLGWTVQLLAAFLALIGAAWWRRGGSGLPLTLAAAGLAAGSAMTGHATSGTWSPVIGVTVHAVHALAAGAWIGTLAVLVLAVLPRTRAASDLLAIVARFSPVALVSAGVLAAGGAAMIWVVIAGPPRLLDAAWGRLLMAKLVLVGAVVAGGAWNWKRATPAVRAGADHARLVRGARWELAIAMLVLLVTALLVDSAPPER
ncbi:MAG: CopD family protein [Gemmatimonadales bacterium]